MKRECACFLHEVHTRSFGTVKDGKHSGEMKVLENARQRDASSVKKDHMVCACSAAVERNSTKTKMKYQNASNSSSSKTIH